MARRTQLLQLALTLATSVVAGVIARAGPYDPPPTYYNSATGTGATLKTQLHDIIANHTALSYDSARTNLQDTDRDPDNPGHMLLVYDRVSLNVSAINPGGPIPGWDQGASWDREHTWPRSRGVDTSGPDNSDLHQLRPSTPSVNGARGNLNFGGAFGQSFGEKSDGGTVWYPGDSDAGMIARQQFYMAVRYDGTEANTEDLELFAGIPSEATELGNLTRLLEWNYQAVPEDFELRRNHVIYTSYQDNRNPFIDRPEYVWSVFVDQENDSQLYVGGSPAGDGGSTLNLNLGPVIVGAAVPAAQNVTLHKNGFDGTYYEVTTSGLATSSVTGRYNAFKINNVATDSRSMSIGLNTTTASAGLKSGSVVVNNLDVTTESQFNGRGAEDADDTINVSLNVYDHANPSFLGGSDQNVLTLDFGTVTQDLTSPTMDFDIFNLINTASFTASLELDSVIASGDVGVLSTDLAAFTGGSALAAGANNMFTATLDTSGVGNFSATYTLSFSDENLPGASALGDLTLNLVGQVAASVENANFNGDSAVDGQDFLIWQRGFGVGTTLAEGDANNDHLVNGADLAIWESQYGTATLSAAVSLPEPCTLLLVMGSWQLVFLRRRPAHVPYGT